MISSIPPPWHFYLLAIPYIHCDAGILKATHDSDSAGGGPGPGLDEAWSPEVLDRVKQLSLQHIDRWGLVHEVEPGLKALGLSTPNYDMISAFKLRWCESTPGSKRLLGFSS